ncbi:MAG: peroxide stress protein YaaA [Roseinatronobacter sp.]
MLVVLSPAKKLDWSPYRGTRQLATPRFQAQAMELAALSQSLGAEGLKRLMHISDQLAMLNAERFVRFTADPASGNPRPAIYGFAGDTYTGLAAKSLDTDALDWAEGHLRILSGLYGVLRPFDALQEYRLEMGSRLQNAQGATLYAYWGDRVARALAADAQAVGAQVLVNCASTEYFGAVDIAALGLPVITPVFLDSTDDRDAKVISFHAKKARGAMARFILEHRVQDPRALRDFTTGGYAFDPDRSTPDKPVFLRHTPS